MFRCQWIFVISYVVLSSSSDRVTLSNYEDKLLALKTGKENHFYCENEVKIHESDCSYEIKGRNIEISAIRRCKVRFGCNSTIFMALCCFEDHIERKQMSQETVQISTGGRNETQYGNNETDNKKSSLFNLKTEDNFISIKMDGTFKLLLLLLILLLMVMLTSIVFCKIWCLKRMIASEPNTYAVFKDNLQVQQDRKLPANIDALKKNENLINLNQEIQQSIGDGIAEIDCSNIPLKV